MADKPLYTQENAERIIAAYLNLPDGIKFDLTDYSESDVHFKITVERPNLQIGLYAISLKMSRDLGMDPGSNASTVRLGGVVHINKASFADGDHADKHVLSIIEEAAEAQITLF